VLLLAPGCAVASSSAPTLKEFQPDVVAIPHALFDPSAADKIARRASYSAWVELNVAWGEGFQNVRSARTAQRLLCPHWLQL
jgi:hypothetical protein